MKDIKFEIKKRFLKVMMIILSDQLEGIGSEADFAISIDIAPQQLSHIKNEENRNVTIEMIYNLRKKYNINSNFIISGELPIRIGKDSNADKLRKIEKIINS